MKLLREMLVILVIYFIGEGISKFFGLSVPGNIIGMILLLLLLCTKIIKVEAVETVANFFLDHLAFFFVPAGVGLITAMDLLKGNTLKLLFVCIVSTMVVLVITGFMVQAVIRLTHRKSKEKV